MAVQMLGIKTKFTDDQGRPLIGGSVHTYYAGTSLPQDTFSDPELTVPNTNPVRLDDTGSANIFLKGTYRVRVFDIKGAFVEEQDNVDQLATVAEVSKNKGGLNAANERIDALESEVNSVKEKTIIVDSIADLSTIKNPKDGLRVYVKSYHAGLGKGGGYFTYDSSKSAENDGGTVVNGWVRNKKGVYEAEELGFKKSDAGLTEGCFDNSPIWESVKNTMQDGYIIKFGDGHYYFDQPMVVSKSIGIEGTVRDNTSLVFLNSSGIVREVQNGYVKNFTLRGSKTDITLKPEDLILGNVGLHDRFDRASGKDGSYNNLQDVQIIGFDVGRAITGEGSSLWAGAYREHLGLVCILNRIGVVFLNGATHERFFGGNIGVNDLVGVWAHSPANVSNISFFGTTIEGSPLNCPKDAVGRQDETTITPLYCNIYVGERSHVGVFGGYLEKSSVLVSVNGTYTEESTYNDRLNTIVSYGTVVKDNDPYWGKRIPLRLFGNPYLFLWSVGVDNASRSPISKIPDTHNSNVHESIKGTRFTVNSSQTGQFSYIGFQFKETYVPASKVGGVEISINSRVIKTPSPNFKIDCKLFVIDTGGNSRKLPNPRVVPDSDILRKKSIMGEQAVTIIAGLDFAALPVPPHKLSVHEKLRTIQVSFNVIDTTTGKNAVIPQGTEFVVDILDIQAALYIKGAVADSIDMTRKILTTDDFTVVSANATALDAGLSAYSERHKKYLTWNGATWCELPAAVLGT